ncbi:hypothetical protein [Paracoccus sanguinis]|uniref:Uncharacterized protein n=1 Tax=Paracoccus sanguinis TaxID=1545044 RepID=A0A1H3BR67_9RHOB|nr:hypothetical protein [Paracoccus sanguinis]KGJ18696.1 hypothetical protein IX57_02920 [Paracoccus sanguinis]SDX44275.1 hypothetical protein SAMN05444276_106123 [Paracoccus sanguinis]
MLAPETFTTLPYDFLWLFATGYVAYRIAFVGRNSHHKTFDETFLVVVFATLARLISALLATLAGTYSLSGSVLATLGTLCLAIVWRRWLSCWLRKTLREAKLVDHDGHADVWRSMLAEDLRGPTQLVVVLKSGKSYLCDDLARFNDAPLGPCLWGEDGSVAMYITALRKQGEAWQDCNPEGENGFELSFFKAADIERIDITRRA